MEGNTFWLISAPKTREDTFNTLNKKTSDEHDFSENNKFQVPDLKVGTLDSLFSLSDDLQKIDAQLENVTRKIAQTLVDLMDSKQESFDLMVNNTKAETYLRFFRWDEARYSSGQPLRVLTDAIAQSGSKIDEELRMRLIDFNQVSQSVAAEERKSQGSWMTKELSDVIKPEHLVESEFMEALFVVVPVALERDFETSYENLTEFVVPRSKILIDEDKDTKLYRVVVFKKIVEDFKHSARDRKFTVRDFKMGESKNSKADRKKMEDQRDKIKAKLIRWCKTHFSEAFVAWIHLKAIRVFVESVLRYGLPTNFQAMLMLPKKNRTKKLQKVLFDLYGNLSKKGVFDAKEDEADEAGMGMVEKFFPYVFLEISLDFRQKNLY